MFDCHVCEVGAGPGSITRSILQAGVRHLAAVEIDQRFLPVLEVNFPDNDAFCAIIYLMGNICYFLYSVYYIFSHAFQVRNFVY